MLHRVPLRIRVSSETCQRLQRLRTRRHLNLGSRLPPSLMRPSTASAVPLPRMRMNWPTPVRPAPLEPIPGWTPARLMLNEVGPKAQHFIENRSSPWPGSAVWSSDPIVRPHLKSPVASAVRFCNCSVRPCWLGSGRGWRCLQSRAIRRFCSLRLPRTADGPHSLTEQLPGFSAPKRIPRPP